MSLKDDIYPNIVSYVTPFSPIDMYRPLGGTCCLHITLKREAAVASEMRSCILSGWKHHNPEDGNLSNALK